MRAGKRLTIIQAGTLFIIFTAILLFEQAYAQTGPPAGFDSQESFEQFMSDYTKELNLTKEQESQIRSILEEQFTEQKACLEKKSSGRRNFRTMKKEMKRIRENTNSKLKPVLTEEQMKKFQDLWEERRKKMRKEMRQKRSMK